MTKRRTCIVVLTSVLLAATAGCSSNNGSPSSSTSSSPSASATPSDTAMAEAGAQVKQLLDGYLKSASSVVVRQNAPFRDVHHAEVALAKACHALVSGLASSAYPSDVQPLVTTLRDAYATGCAQNDALAEAKTSAQLAKVKISSTLPAEITEAKAALYVALGIQGP